MQRQFTKDIGKRADGSVRWTEGEVLDYPFTTWKQIAQDLGKPLEFFTRAIDARPTVTHRVR